MSKWVLALFLSLLLTSWVDADEVWFEAGQGVTYNTQLQRYELSPHTTATVHVIADFAVSGMGIGAITVRNGGDIADQGVFSPGSVHSNLVYDPFFSAGQLEDGSDANKNVVIFQVKGGLSLVPGQDVAAPAGEALYSFDITAAQAGTVIDIDDLTGGPGDNPFGPYPLVTSFTSTGSHIADDITALTLFVVEGSTRTITVSSDGSGDYPTIQQGIDAAENGDVIILSDGIYTGQGNGEIDFKGKSVTLRSEKGPANCILDCRNTGRAFYFHSGEDAGSVIEGLTIRNGHVAGGCNGGAIYCQETSPTVRNCIFTANTADVGGAIYNSAGTPRVANCTFVGNSAVLGGAFFETESGVAEITNSIFRDNSGGQIYGQATSVSYSDVQHGYPGPGNIDADPVFADSANGDFHLKSIAGRIDAGGENWLYDDRVTSPCIDAGNPGCALGDEPETIDNTRINMGAYGGTGQASRSPENWALPGDLTNDGGVDFKDYAVFARYWSDSAACVPADLDLTGSVDFFDFSVLIEQWLAVSVR